MIAAWYMVVSLWNDPAFVMRTPSEISCKSILAQSIPVTKQRFDDPESFRKLQEQARKVGHSSLLFKDVKFYCTTHPPRLHGKVIHLQ